MKRKTICRLIPLVCALGMALSACSGQTTAEPTASPVPTAGSTPAPTPSPTPEPVIAVFGATSAQSFQDGVSFAANSGAYGVEFISGGVEALAGYRPEGAAAAIVFLEGSPDTLPKTDLPIYVYAARGQSVPMEIPHLIYVYTGAAKLALDCAVSYPPHLTPVRMIGLFLSEADGAYTLWTNAQQRGIVFSKLEYIAETSESTPTDFLTDAFSAFSPGTLDAVYAETGELALLAAEMLASLGRDDLEVFSAGTDADADRALSSILICAAGANLKTAGARCYEEAAKLLSGEPAQTGLLMPEALWYSLAP
ncbi:MAG: hypothetical protein GX417_11840 [Clostridiales bacterium]|nr:hypothetical protein [Clostridiales bacterium]